MLRMFFAIVCIGILITACNNNASDTTDRKNGYSTVLKTKEDSLYHDVEEGHNAGMAKVGKVRKSMDEVQHQLDSISKLPAQKVNAAYKQSLIGLQKDLNDANNEMNDWMDHFKPDSAANNRDQRIQYLQAEKEKITTVKEHMLNSLQKADSLFRKS
jgi:paraquat-inducible protein B